MRSLSWVATDRRVRECVVDMMSAHGEEGGLYSKSRGSVKLQTRGVNKLQTSFVNVAPNWRRAARESGSIG